MGSIQHIAIIMDGNRRWAKEQGLYSWKGHEAGAEVLKKISDHCLEKGIKYLTVYALSTENLKRTAEELAVHFGLHKKYIKKEILDTDRFMKDRIRFNVIGNLSKLPKDEQELIKQAMEKTKDNDNFIFNVCLAYDGQEEILEAVKELVKKGVKPEDINMDLLKKNMYSKDIPAPEMIIRTGMNPEKRLSGFLLWDCSYSEFFFTSTKWPAFTTDELDRLISEFLDHRERRFGK
ncbi:di-trans,poly-cis-decaprenylcistransferase [Candidatus Woesearchaeota archaeon]|nr:di-trans,poly-cis-decaprenylcistransferase [Candidatus Woesearchaeota archaeon]MBW3017707.1 di-trans,poly-cis-decaprenylcistransferase [Candidatus Woesearchaeota archaeon]